MNIMKLNYIIIFLFLCVAGDGLAAIYVKQSGQTDKIYYAHKDHLGSIIKLTDASGTEVFKAAYDPWGNRKVFNNSFNFHRGFTGHEHLPEFNLINMNGRLYDPQLGSFLSPDPFVQAPDYLQSCNRYSYCLNNPLKYTDPSGEIFGIDDLVAAAIGGTFNLVSNLIQGNTHSVGEAFAQFGVGAAAGVASLYVGPVAAGAILSGGNSFVNQGFGEDGNWNWNNISGYQIAFDATVGGITAGIGSKIGGTISPHVESFTSKLGGKAIQEMATQSITGAAAGFTIGTGIAVIEGHPLGKALEAGGKNAVSGTAAGAISGLGTGIRAAQKAGENPWTGVSKDITIYRAVSIEEYNDILNNGFRSNPTGEGYQGSKLFYKSYNDAIQNTKAYDARFGQKSIILEIRVPNTYNLYIRIHGWV
jgi:RHS repeat-associated protein